MINWDLLINKLDKAPDRAAKQAILEEYYRPEKAHEAQLLSLAKKVAPDSPHTQEELITMIGRVIGRPIIFRPTSDLNKIADRVYKIALHPEKFPNDKREEILHLICGAVVREFNEKGEKL